MKKKIQIPHPSVFSGTPSKPAKLPSPLICFLSEFSSSWKAPNVGSRLRLLQLLNLSTIVYHTMKSAKLSNAICPHKCFNGVVHPLKYQFELWAYSHCALLSPFGILQYATILCLNKAHTCPYYLITQLLD